MTEAYIPAACVHSAKHVAKESRRLFRTEFSAVAAALGESIDHVWPALDYQTVKIQEALVVSQASSETLREETFPPRFLLKDNDAFLFTVSSIFILTSDNVRNFVSVMMNHE